MRIVSYNILNGGIGRADPIGEVLQAQDADVIIMVEADDNWVIDRIAKRLKMDVAVGAGETHGVAVLSRHSISATINRAVLDPGGPRSWLEARIDPAGGESLVVHAIHLTARASIDHEQKRLSELRRVLAATQSLRASRMPHVLAGDFNANAPQQRIDIGRCKPSTRKAFADNGNAIPRDAVGLLLQHEYVDSLAAVRGDAAFDAATFTTYQPGQRVDYIFTFGLTPSEAWIEQDRLATYASDHYPVGAVIPSKAAK